MKPIKWLGDTHKVIKGYPVNVRQEIGYNLDKVQRGIDPFDWKPMSAVGHGVKEIRIHEENEYRVLYVAKFQEEIYVLHSFVKKTQQTSQKDIDLGKRRYSEMLNLRRIQMKPHITKGSIFDDLEFDEMDASNLKIRAALMRAIEQELDKRNLTQAQASKLLDVSQPRISDLKRGKMHLFTIDMLVNMLAKLDKPVRLIIDDRIAA